MRLSIQEIFEAVRGSYVVQPVMTDEEASGITWDSRTVSPGNVYLALVGEHVDGHAFAKQAIEAGASCVLAMHDVSDDACAAARKTGAAIIAVEDTQLAIVHLASAWRAHLQGRVIALSGSTGKTTTKNLVREVLGASGSVVATEGNQNNELGVPKTLLNANADTQSVVVEMGMRGLHQLDALCGYVKPVWGLITNVGESHIELLGSRENIARAKAELFASLPAGEGVAFLNIADDYAQLVCEFADVAKRGVGLVCYDGSADACAHVESFAFDNRTLPFVWARDIRLDEQGRATFTLCAQGFGQMGLGGVPHLVSAPCKLELRGMHNVSNACAAAAVGYASGMTIEQCAQALSAATPEPGRQNILQSSAHAIDVAGKKIDVAAGITVVDDSYNANPDSMRASLATFSALTHAGKRVAVLGDMGELGSFADDCHRRVGAFAAGCGLDLLVCVGDLSASIADEAVAQGMAAADVVKLDSADEALAFVAGRLCAGDAVLVKASHFMEFDRIVKGLVG